jgi:RHH-type proline utilization regulon transcriptional repressor/proline dehydrogenase/delta 1-pyrroline-5-carboxylate dehydrogenase
VQGVLFTGSRAVGLSIIRACSEVPPGQRFVKRVVAELGGKNAILVDADADLDAAVAGTLRAAFGYGGQKCSAASRVLVHQAVYDRFLARLAAAADRLVVGDPADPGTDLGPLIEEAAQRRLQEAVRRAGTVGRLAYRYPDARLPQAGYFVGPAIAADVPPRDPLAQEELFGPLLCVFRAATFGEALALANDTDYALTGGIYSRSPSHIERAVREFDVGNLYVNRPITGALVGRQPFGGHRLSGLGTKAGGPDYLLSLLVPRTVCWDTTRYGMPLD